MPIYEYCCSACGHQLEEFQKISDAPLTECPQCHKPTLQKMISASGFQLKGTGWYKTDYSSKGKPPQQNQTSKSENSTDKAAGTESKSDTKKSTDTSSGSSSSSSGESS